ncbi:hypothetical protein HanIR_Chr04g0160641 [Helianthus annuus]|nr:hypothetical protein HanIR_Chr04g0160641 [Helianthus annuus]
MFGSELVNGFGQGRRSTQLTQSTPPSDSTFRHKDLGDLGVPSFPSLTLVNNWIIGRNCNIVSGCRRCMEFSRMHRYTLKKNCIHIVLFYYSCCCIVSKAL